MSDARTFTAVKHEGALHYVAPIAYAQFLTTVGDGEVVTVTIEGDEAKKTRAQERGYHVMIAPLAKHFGWELEDVKRYFLAEVFGWRENPNPLTGERMLNEPRTSQLSKAKYSELIERTMDIAATKMDFVLVSPDEWRFNQGERWKREHGVTS